MKKLTLSLIAVLFSTTFAHAKTVELCADGEYSALGQSGNKLLIGGTFSHIGRCTRHGAMAIPLNGQTWGQPKFYDKALMGYSHFATRAPQNDGYIIDTQTAGDIFDAEFRLSWLHQDGSVTVLGMPKLSVDDVDIDGDELWAFGFGYDPEGTPQSVAAGVNLKTGAPLPPKFNLSGTAYESTVHNHMAYLMGSDFVVNGTAINDCTVRIDVRSGKVEPIGGPNSKARTCSKIYFYGGKAYRMRDSADEKSQEIVEYDENTLKELRVVSSIARNGDRVTISAIHDGVLFALEDNDKNYSMGLYAVDLQTSKQITVIDKNQAPAIDGNAWLQAVDGLLIFQSNYEYTFKDGRTAWVVGCHLSTGQCEPMAGSSQGFGEAPRMIYADNSAVLFGPIFSMDVVKSVSVVTYDLDADKFQPLNIFKYDDDFIPFDLQATADPSVILTSDPFQAVAINLNSGMRQWNIKAAGGALLKTFPYLDRVAFGGDFTQLSTSTRLPFFDNVDQATGKAMPRNPRPDKSVLGISYDDTTRSLWLGGNFTKMGSETRHNVAGFDFEGKLLPQSWELEGKSLSSVYAANGYLFLIGDFDAINGTPFKTNLIKVNTVTGGVENWRTDLPFATQKIEPFDHDNLLAFSDGAHPSMLVNKVSGISTPFYPNLLGSHELYAAKSLTDRPGFAAAQVGKLTIWEP